MYGTQTSTVGFLDQDLFENDVKMYGTQTCGSSTQGCWLFENDVKMYGTQTETELYHAG